MPPLPLPSSSSGSRIAHAAPPRPRGGALVRAVAVGRAFGRSFGRALALLALAAPACAPSRFPRPSAPDAPRPSTYALVVNGGGHAASNYLSHAKHVSEMYEVLVNGGLDPGAVAVLGSDGAADAHDATAVRAAAGPHAWLLDGTHLEETLGRPRRTVNSLYPSKDPRPATRDGLRDWFEEAARGLRAGDRVVLFVTDHGSRGARDEETAITLWSAMTGPQAVTVRELARALDRLPAGVRTTMVMSQCFSGAFAEAALRPLRGSRPPGAVCGYFSTTADRFAYGCTPDARPEAEEGHAFAFVRALGRTGSFAAAHRAALADDRASEVPFRTSDVLLRRFVERLAREDGVDPDAFVERVLPEALERDAEGRETLAAVWGAILPGTTAKLTEFPALRTRIQALRTRAFVSARVWGEAMGDLAQENLDGFLDARPAWRDRTTPRALQRFHLLGIGEIQHDFLEELGPWSAGRRDRHDLLKVGHARRALARSLFERASTRSASLHRLRTLASSAVGRHLLPRWGTPAERQEHEALRACEELDLPRRSGRVVAPHMTRIPAPYTRLDADERLLEKTAPAALGATLAATPGAPAPGVLRVIAVEPEGPAARAGLRPGDVIAGAGATFPRDGASLKLALALAPAGAPLSLELLRDGGRRSVSVAPEPPRTSALASFTAAERTVLRRLRAYEGEVERAFDAGKPILLFFWASWCAPCKEAVPALLALEARGHQVVAVTSEDELVVNEFFRQWGGRFPARVALDADGAAEAQFGVSGYPTFVLVDERAGLRKRWSGFDRTKGLGVP